MMMLPHPLALAVNKSLAVFIRRLTRESVNRLNVPFGI